MYLEKLIAAAGWISFSLMVYLAGVKAVTAFTCAAHQWAGHINSAMGSNQ